MRERSYFHKMEFRDGNISHLDRENIKYYNSLQVYSSNRQVYSMANNFELLNEMLIKKPELKRPRPRFEISGDD